MNDEFVIFRHDVVGSRNAAGEIISEPKVIHLPARPGTDQESRMRGPIAMITHVAIIGADNKIYYGYAAKVAHDQVNRPKARKLALLRANSHLWDITHLIDRSPEAEATSSLQSRLHAAFNQIYTRMVDGTVNLSFIK